MNVLYTQAVKKASQLRLKLGFDLFQPINIYDVCSGMQVDVQFVNISMEGFYINNVDAPKILVSSLRPFARRIFTCGHELGHHVFNHGSSLDVIADESEDYSIKSEDEKLVDSFSAALLMPVGGVQIEFKMRNLSFQSANPIDYFTVSSVFGVGYRTLVTHCKVNRLINDAKWLELLKFSPAKIFKTIFGDIGEKNFFKIIDGLSDLGPIDIEVSNYLVLPSNFSVENDFLEKKQESAIGSLYFAKKAGILAIHSKTNGRSYFVRIQPKNYIGFAEYRHLEQ